MYGCYRHFHQTFVLRGLNTRGRFSAILYKVATPFSFRFAVLHINPFLKWGLFLKERICSVYYFEHPTLHLKFCIISNIPSYSWSCVWHLFLTSQATLEVVYGCYRHFLQTSFVLRGLNTRGWFYVILYMVATFAVLHVSPLLKRGLLLKERICSTIYRYFVLDTVCTINPCFSTLSITVLTKPTNDLYFLFFISGKTYFFQGDQYWEFYDNKMKARKKSPKPIGKIFGCRNGKLNIHNIERKAPTGELTSVDIHDGLSGSDRVHYIVTNLVLFLILYYCLHWCWFKLGQIEVLIYFIAHQQCFSHLDVALWWKQRHK